MTFKEYYALLRRKHLQEDRERLNAGFIYSAIWNTNGGIKGEVVQPTAIVPSMQPEPPDMTKMSPKGMKNYLFWVFQGQGKSRM